jgi:hypothetical protein
MPTLFTAPLARRPKRKLLLPRINGLLFARRSEGSRKINTANTLLKLIPVHTLTWFVSRSQSGPSVSSEQALPVYPLRMNFAGEATT